MPHYTMKEAVHVDLRAEGEDHSGDYGPGDVVLPGPVAELLTAQGHAIEAKGKPGKTAAPVHIEPEA